MTSTTQETGIPPVPPAADYPLSSAQLSMWLTAQTADQNGAYTVPMHYRISGPVNPKLLHQALHAVCERHESLRTSFRQGTDGVRQVVFEQPDLDWTTDTVSEAELEPAAAAFFGRGFELAAGGLLRAMLLSTSAESHHLLLSAHHIIMDAWSAQVLAQELQQRYTALSAGADPGLPTLPRQYRDYAGWQQQRLKSALDDARGYWCERFAELPEPLNLPTDRPRPAHRDFAGATLRTVLPDELARAFTGYARSARVSPFAPLLAVTRVLLHRYTGQRDVVLGVPSLDRPFAVLYDQIGCYLNTVALRDTVAESTTFNQLVATVNGTLRDGMRHGEVPFNLVVQDCAGATDRSRNPLFDVMVSYLPDSGEEPPDSALPLQPVPTENAHSKLDLTLFFEEREGRFEIAAEYSTALFDAARITDLLEHLQVLLGHALAAPDVPVETLGIMSAAQTELVVSRFNDTDRPYDLDRTVVAQFEDQAQRTPAATAITDGLSRLSYAEFEHRTRAVANALIEEHGVRPDDIVALRIPRSIDLVMAIWGVLRAGAAYLPLNLSDPAERIAQVLEDSACRAVLAAGTDRVFSHPALDVRALAARPAGPELPKNPRVTAGQAAYCIYTSGSTGAPKGIRIGHRALSNRLQWMREELGLSSQDVFLQKTAASFDVSVWELVLPFTLGAQQVLLPAGAEGDPARIETTIRRHGVSVLHFVPSMLSAYLDDRPDGLPGVRVCVCSGEALERPLADRFFAAHQITELWNYYGPTEATIDVTSVRVPRTGSVTIGRPAANNRLYVLDPLDQPLPPGVPGNLCIAGVQVGEGYLNRPGLSAERFTRIPALTEGTLYRTGDQAAWTRQGELRYLGRDDHQVKIRGYRIELGDIETALLSHPGISRAVLLPVGEQAAAALLAFVVLGPDHREPLDDAALRKLLRKQLPGYMIPARFIPVPEVPVTGNGKIDRKALLALSERSSLGNARETTAGQAAEPPSGHARDAGDPASAMQGVRELELLAIWSELLPPGSIGRFDDFFDIGGHSLLVLRLRGRLLERLGIDIDTAALFRHSTIAAQATLLESATGGAGQRFTSRSLGSRSPLSHDQERMWFLHLLEPDSTAYNIRALADIRGALDFELLRESFAQLQQRHEILRVTYGMDEGRPYQLAHSQLPLRFEHLDLRSLVGEQALAAAERRILAEETQTFALSSEAPLRATLMTLGEEQHQLLITLHHIAGDGWSMRLLTGELAEIYSALRDHQQPALPELPLQYRDYATAVREPGYQAESEAQLAWWVENLAGTPRLALPTDPSPTLTAGTIGVRTPGELSQAASRRLRQSHLGTDFETAMAALVLLLSRLSGQQDVSVGFPVTNRPEVALERLIGLFVNTLVLRVEVPEAATFSELLALVRERLRAAYQHQEASFGAVVERLNPERDVNRPPVFDVMLNDVGSVQAEARIPGLELRFSDEVFEPEAKVPFAFYLSRTAGADGEVLHLELVHRPDLATPERGSALVAQYLGLLEQIAENPGRPLAEYSLVVPGDLDGATALGQSIDAPLLPTVPELIRARAAEHPDATAVEQGERRLSYRELVQAAERIAKQVCAIGVRRGQVVAVTGSRSPGFLAALLGVLSSGAVFLPIDPALPYGRLARLLDVGQPALCLRTDPALPPLPGVADLLVDAEGSAIDRQPGAEAGIELPTLGRDDAAYLFFTSGTTGTPKGVLGRHQSLAHFLLWEREAAQINERDRVAQLTSLSFDVMLRDSLIALISGGTTVLPGEADGLSGTAVLRWLSRERITVLHTVPTVLRSWLLDAPAEALFGTLRTVLFAGEPLPGELVDKLRAVVPGDCEVFNLYGPTETTLAKLAYRLPAGPATPGVQQIGRPLPQCQALVMSGNRPCGVSELGEIVLRTPFRSLGYLHDPKATDAAFVTNPLTGDAADKLYYTGDLGRVRPDGGIDIFGRRDHQVKLNGVRIQPGEIEQVLLQHPQVEAAALVTFGSSEDKVLIGYAVVAEDAAAAAGTDHRGIAGTLRAFLRDQLPAAMVPSEILLVPGIPVTQNGKLDRNALPAPQLVTTDEQATLAASSPVEQAILGFWEQVLDRPVPGVDLDFFALGGTSMKLLRLFALLDERFPQQLRIAQLFSHATIQQQAELVSPASTPGREEQKETVQEYDF